MDELLGAFSAASVSSEPNSTAAPHPRYALYKVKASASSQEERRKKFLEAQKLKRYDYVSHARGLATSEWEDDGTARESEQGDNEDEMDVDVQRKPSKSYKNQLMLSEWLVEVPEDLALNWLLVLCPVGKRCLVIASKGITNAYSRTGYHLSAFPSKLPGGNREQRNQKTGIKSSSYSIIDCIYCQKEKTYYILDIMCWNGHPLYDSDTDFRFYWIDAKVQELPEVMEASPSNPFRFVPLPYYSCDPATLRELLWSELPFPSELDGLLFFHKKTHYRPGATPLIGWLKAFMVPEILGIEVPDSLCKDKPLTYTTMKAHVPKAFAKNERRKAAEERIMHCEDS